jgi:hypothetical protein
MSKIYERIMQVRSGRWEIGVIEDHQARPLTEEEMQETINKLNAVLAAPPADGGLREALEKWNSYRELRKYGNGPGTALAYEQACEETDAALGQREQGKGEAT